MTDAPFGEEIVFASGNLDTIVQDGKVYASLTDLKDKITNSAGIWLYLAGHTGMMDKTSTVRAAEFFLILEKSLQGLVAAKLREEAEKSL